MAKVSIGADEYWPYPVFEKRGGTEIEVPAGTLKRWRRVLNEADKVVDEIWAVVHEKEARDRDGDA